MINRDKSGLEIFDNFHIDYNLPKWKNRKEQSTTPEGNSIYRTYIRSSRNNIINDSFIISDGLDVSVVFGNAGTISNATMPNKESFFDRLFGRSKKRRLLEEEKIKAQNSRPNFTIQEVKEVKEEMSPSKFFESIKNSAEELIIIKEKYENYEKTISYLERTGQIAMLERMNFELDIHRAEAQLLSSGFKKVITEKNIIDFADKSCRDIRLDWVKNFTRLIPEKVLIIKEELDEKHIFDNYLILHFDPYRDGNLKTLSEIKKEEEKDPILFGVIAGSNKLYYIADWVDEYCNLTFDKLVEKLGEDAINANDLSVEVKISSY